jgi:hypothetical protein
MSKPSVNDSNSDKSVHNEIVLENFCAICQMSLQNDDNNELVVLLECKHAFHKKCASNWKKKTCPCCRQNYMIDDDEKAPFFLSPMIYDVLVALIARTRDYYDEIISLMGELNLDRKRYNKIRNDFITNFDRDFNNIESNKEVNDLMARLTSELGGAIATTELLLNIRNSKNTNSVKSEYTPLLEKENEDLKMKLAEANIQNSELKEEINSDIRSKRDFDSNKKTLESRIEYFQSRMYDLQAQVIQKDKEISRTTRGFNNEIQQLNQTINKLQIKLNSAEGSIKFMKWNFESYRRVYDDKLSDAVVLRIRTSKKMKELKAERITNTKLCKSIIGVIEMFDNKDEYERRYQFVHREMVKLRMKEEEIWPKEFYKLWKYKYDEIEEEIQILDFLNEKLRLLNDIVSREYFEDEIDY